MYTSNKEIKRFQTRNAHATLTQSQADPNTHRVLAHPVQDGMSKAAARPTHMGAQHSTHACVHACTYVHTTRVQNTQRVLSKNARSNRFSNENAGVGPQVLNVTPNVGLIKYRHSGVVTRASSSPRHHADIEAPAAPTVGVTRDEIRY